MTTDIIGCKKICEIMNRPAYIVLFKGDDSDFEGNQSVDIVIDTELDTTGMKAHFRFMDFVQDVDSIPENKTLSLVFPNAKTSEFPLGAADATLRFEDASGKFRTVSNRIHIVVTNSVHEAYDNEDSQSITVTVKGTVTWEMIEGKPTFATVATSGSYNDLTDKPTIPAPVDISGKLDGAAAYPAWDSTHPYEDGDTVSYGGRIWWADGTPTLGFPPGEDAAWNETSIGIYLSVKQDALTSAQLAAVNSGATAEKVATWDGYAAQIAQKANASDLPYALVTPGEWSFSGLTEYATGTDMLYDTGYWTLYIYYDGETDSFTAQGSENDLVVAFEAGITATRPSLPGHLCDRAVNAVSVSGDTTLTLPALVNADKARDLLVRLEISGSTVPTITFAAPTGETITYETDGDEFPVPDEAGDWLYSFTETAAHTFAVALKKVNTVAQGGS